MHKTTFLDEDHSAQNNMFWMEISTARLVITMALALHKTYHVLDEDHSTENNNMFWMKIGKNVICLPSFLLQWLWLCTKHHFWMKICKTLVGHFLDEEHCAQNNRFWMKIGKNLICLPSLLVQWLWLCIKHHVLDED